MSFANSGKFSAFALPQATLRSPAVTKIKPVRAKSPHYPYLKKYISLHNKIRITNHPFVSKLAESQNFHNRMSFDIRTNIIPKNWLKART
jgi:hypothetical protein